MTTGMRVWPDRGDLTAWLGRIEVAVDTLTAPPAERLAATLDHEPSPWEPGTPLPELWHWLYFLQACPQAEIGTNGHAHLGGFLPPVPLPRRMWAGGRIEFAEPLRIGESATRTSRIEGITEKTGRSGRLVFVRVRHQIARETGITLTEEQDLVYRQSARPGEPVPEPTPAPTDEAFSRTVEPSPALLFRYSALTFNAHRIHYDRGFCREEGYPGLIVHGPLIATLLVDLLESRLAPARLRSFTFRAVRPVCDVAPFEVCGRPAGDDRRVHLWARDHDGWLAMEATAELA